MRMIIDRFEGDFAVCEQTDQNITRILRSILPVWAREGDVLQVDGDNITIDQEATAARRREADDMLEELRG